MLMFMRIRSSCEFRIFLEGLMAELYNSAAPKKQRTSQSIAICYVKPGN